MNKRRIIDRFHKNWDMQIIYSIPIPRSEPNCIIATEVLISDSRKLKSNVIDITGYDKIIHVFVIGE